jgi:MFS family permease
VLALLASQIMLFFGAGNVFVLLAALVVFFSAFNVMEASLPSLITKVAPPDVKGTATGVYSSLQFFGIFIGGVIGGMAHQHAGSAGVFAVTTALAVIWLLAAAGMAQPSYFTTRLVPVGENRLSDATDLATKLRQVPGVVEAVIIAEENLAYLKVDAKSFDAAMAEAVAGASPGS